MLGKKHSAEVRQKIGDAQRGRHLSLETKEKIRQVHLGKKLSHAHRVQLSKAKKGRIIPALMENLKKAVFVSVSLSRGQKLPAERRLQMSLVQMGHPTSDETKAKISARWTPERRAALGVITAARNRSRACQKSV